MDLGTQLEVAGDGMGVYESVGLVVGSVFGDGATDFGMDRVASVFSGSMAHFDTSVTRMAVSAHGPLGSPLDLRGCLG